MQYKVLLTTSGIGSRLGEITDYTNKGLVKVGKKPAISYIIESYPKTMEFVVTVGYFADHVKQFLNIAYPDRKFTFVEIDNYSGEGSSLGYSQLCAKEHLQCPFIYNACDTIVLDSIPEPDRDWVGGFKQKGSSQYDSYCVTNGNVKEFYTKGHIDSDYVYIGLIGVNDYENYWETMEELYNNDTSMRSLSDLYCVRNQLARGKKIYHKQFMTWYDIGNVESLNKARTDIPDSFNILDKLEESIYLFDDHVIKFFANETMASQRIDRASILDGMVPKIVAKSNNFYRYEYAKGDLYSSVANPKTFINLLDWAKENLWKKVDVVSDKEFKNACSDFYYKKTIARINKFYDSTHTLDQIETINGMTTPTITEMIKAINKDWICKPEQTGFHGDFILDNIILGEDGFTLLDWRQNFGGLIECGDMYYDLAKLNHNLVVNHEIVNNDLFTVKKINGEVVADIHRRQSLIECQEVYHNWILENGYDLNKVKVLTSLIWLNMSALHHHPFDEFLYYYGKYTLLKTLGELENEYTPTYELQSSNRVAQLL